MLAVFASLQLLPRSGAVFTLSERNPYRALSASPDGVAVACVCRLVSKQFISWQNATTEVYFVFKGSQYNSSGVLSYCITISQQWRAVHLHHNTTAVVCCQVPSQYNGGVQSSYITIQRWRAVTLHHSTTAVACCSFESHYQKSGVLSSCITIPQRGVLSSCIKIPQQWRAVNLNHITATRVSNRLKIYYKTKFFVTYLWLIFRRKKKVKFFSIHCSQIFRRALLFGVSCTATVVPSDNIYVKVSQSTGGMILMGKGRSKEETHFNIT